MNRYLFIILIFFTSLLLSFIQENPLERLTAGFARYLEELPQEKIYIHLDRPYYTGGETIWYKVYLTAGPYHEPSQLSQTIYVELINQNKEVIQQIKLLSINGLASGSIMLPDTLKSGKYLLRAYTNWMRNFEESYFFQRSIKIWNINNNDVIKETHDQILDIQFFPEGGNLVADVVCKVGVKAIGADGLGKATHGIIINTKGKTVAEFQCNFLGMGAFSFLPEKGERYKAVIDKPDKEILLPPSLESGLVLSVRNASKELLVRIQTSDYTKYQELYILAQTRGQIVYSARVNLASNVAVARIDKSQFPAGVTQITILDRQGSPLAERLVFVDNPTEHLRIEMSANNKTYAPREKVTLNINVKDSNGNPVVANLSLAVCDDQQVLIEPNQENISTYLLISSELQGHIESPGYYFNNKNSDREDALDFLLLTQGWRRFTINQALQHNWKAPEYLPEKGLRISGQVVDKYNGKAVGQGKVTYLSLTSIPTVSETITNPTGHFSFLNIIYYDSADLILKSETKKGNKAVKILITTDIDRPEITYPITTLAETKNEFERKFFANSAERRAIDSAYYFDEKTIILKNIEIKESRLEPQARIRPFGKGSVNIRVANEPGMENLLHPLQLIQGRVAGVQVTGDLFSWKVLIQGPNSIKSGTNPLILVDDMPFDFESLSAIPVENIESFTVWKGADAAIFGARGANGAIGFYTKRGSNLSTVEEGTFTFRKMGYHVEREFYSPNYSLKNPEYVKPDMRVTLFWSPYIQTDSLGNASVTFFNHDQETTVSGIIEGISSTGKAGFASTQYVIKN